MGTWDSNKTFAANVGIAYGTERFYIFMLLCLPPWEFSKQFALRCIIKSLQFKKCCEKVFQRLRFTRM